MATDITHMKAKTRTAIPADFPEKIELTLEQLSVLRYGENYNQPAAVFRLKQDRRAELTNIRLAKTGKEGLSATNYMDAARAQDLLKFFSRPAITVMKHTNPCGFSVETDYERKSQSELFLDAWNADSLSAFGGVVAFNRPVQLETAQMMLDKQAGRFIEVIIAPEFEDGVMGVLEKKANLRAALYSNMDKLPRFEGDDDNGIYDMKFLPSGNVIVQKPFLTRIRSKSDFILDALDQKSGSPYEVEARPTERQLSDMLISWYINFSVRSNGIVIVKDGVAYGIGTGQQARVKAVRHCIVDAYQQAMDRKNIQYDPLLGVGVDFASRGPREGDPLYGAVMSSDAFFPFPDSIALGARVGIAGVVQPCGSDKDYLVIQELNKNKMSMAVTLERCFGHF